jgi:branched-chain amino acid aminotransferase
MITKVIWMDGELVNWDDATVHVTSFGLHYGIGFFEGIRCHSTPAGPAIFRLADHLRRLRRSAAIYGFGLPYGIEDISAACRSVVKANHVTDCYLRPIVFLGDGPDPISAKLRTAVIATEDGPLAAPGNGGRNGGRSGGVSARISTFSKISVNALPPAAKATGQYLNSLLAQGEAIRSGCEEAILLNSNGFVADGWAHNIFVVQDEAVITPPLSAGALAGITRDTIMTLAREAGFEVREQDLIRSDLYLADECFLTGTAAGLVPVASVDGRPVGGKEPGPVTGKLTGLLSEVTLGTTDAHPEWREAV